MAAKPSLSSATMPAFAEAPDERARMGRISGGPLDPRLLHHRRQLLPAGRPARADGLGLSILRSSDTLARIGGDEFAIKRPSEPATL